jgi:glutathione synthase/RimK-type ligase-like ATP-grasp enzyme
MNIIVKNSDKVFITNTVNFHNGANAKRINIRDITQENLDLFVKAHQLIGLECSGVDYMSYDIKIPYYKNKGHIIEVNDMVDTKIHIDADEKGDSDLLFNNIINVLQNN